MSFEGTFKGELSVAGAKISPQSGPIFLDGPNSVRGD